MIRKIFNLKFLSHQRIPLYNFCQAKRKLPNFNDVEKDIYVALGDAIQGAGSAQLIGNTLKDNLANVTDYHVGFAMYHIWNHQIEIDDDFHTIMLPIIKEFVRNFGREHNKSLANIVKFCGFMNVQDDELWEIFENKIVTERLYRYFPLEELCEVAHGTATAGRGSDELYNIFENEIIKFRLALNDKNICDAVEAFEIAEKGSPLFFQVLDNPEATLEELGKASDQKKIE